MSANRTRPTATILPFAARVRVDRMQARKSPGQSGPAQVAPPIEFGSGWYHDAAIQDAQPDRKG